MVGQENWGPQGHNPEQVPFPGYFGGPQLYMSYYGLMGFNSYQSVVNAGQELGPGWVPILILRPAM